MNLDFSGFDTALTQLGQSITTNAHGARSHLLQLADLQAELDRLKLEAKGKTQITISIEFDARPSTSESIPTIAEARRAFNAKSALYQERLKNG